jgi:hypothetical protein
MRTELKAPAIELFLKEVVLIQYNPFKNKFNPGALNQSSWGLSGGRSIYDSSIKVYFSRSS